MMTPRFFRPRGSCRGSRLLPLQLLALALVGTAAEVLAQEGRLLQIRPQQPGQPLSARDFAQHSGETPLWKNPPGFERDVFTFVRIRYHTRGGRGRSPFALSGGNSYRGNPYGGYRGPNRWATDFPDADLNLSWRLQQMTSLKVDPEPKVIEITDPFLFRYPFIYIVEPGDLELTDEEVPILRRYLLNGGFLMIDDFWGEDEWAVCEEMFKKVFPDRRFFELPLTHPLYHGVFEIKEKYQCANVRRGIESEHGGETWEKPDAKEVHHRGIEDDHGRLMVLTLHNTDTGDGWEREGESDYYFHNFSEKIAYPLGVNIIYYVMTH